MTKLKNLLSGAPAALIASALLMSVCVGCGEGGDDAAPATDAPAAGSTDTGSDTDAPAE